MGLARWMLDLGETLDPEWSSTEVENHKIVYWRAGTGPELLILHGLLGTAAAWEDMGPRLAPDSTVYAMDALGIGESDRVDGADPGLAAQADRVASFMENLGIRSADILATSHGGAVAMILAARHPERVRSLILNAPANPFSDIADSLIRFYRSQLGRWFAHRIPEMPLSVSTVALGRLYGDGAGARQDRVEKYVESLRIPGTVEYLLSLLDRWFPDMQNLEQELGKLRRFPALLVWGDRDRAVSLESAQRLQPYFNRSELVVLPGTGHLPYEECPEVFARTIASFLAQCRAEREPGPKLLRRKPWVNL
jgi:pimeloyl-ACP methyl ester carboxylesterase